MNASLKCRLGNNRSKLRLAAPNENAFTSAFDVGAHAGAGKVWIGGADGVQHTAMLAYGYAKSLGRRAVRERGRDGHPDTDGFGDRGDGALVVVVFGCAGDRQVLLGGILAIRRVAPPTPTVKAGTGENADTADTATLVPAEPALFSIIHLVNLCAYVALFEKAGFSLSTLVFLSIAIFLFGPRTTRSAIVAIIAAAVVTFVVGTGLRVLVGVPLPGVFLG